MDVHDVLSRLQGVKGGGGQWSARCPAHDDKRQSLSISQGKDGQVLLKCHAGCTVESITSALGIEVKDLFQHQEQRPHVVATYTYPTGAQKLRYSDKHFSWRHPDGKGGWEYNRKGIPHSLYVAGDLSGVVFIAEGEKDADNLHKLGYDAVSGEDGAGPGKWRKEYTEQLKGRPVVIFQDNDPVGRDYAQETASALSKVCPQVKILDLSLVWPEIPEHGDVSDLIAHFGPEKAVEMITALIDQTSQWTPAPDTKGRKAKDLFTIQKGNGKLAPKSIQHYLSFVSSVLDYAFRFEMISSNPCKRVVIHTGEAPERDCYTVEEAQIFLESLDQAPIKYKAFFILAIYGGFRRGELLGLEWQDIDFQAQVVKVRRTSQYLAGRGTFTDDTKTEKSHRTLKLPAPVFDVLRQLRAEQAQDRLRLGDQWHNSGRLFVGDTGEPIHPNTPYHWLRRFCQETGQRFLGIHTFRHLNASLLINSGVDVKTVSASLGHSQVTTTLNIYAHTFEEAQARASEAVADLLSKKQA